MDFKTPFFILFTCPDDKLHETALAVMADSFITYSEYGFIYSTYWNGDSHLKNCVVNKEIGKIIHKNRVFFRIRIGHFKTFRKKAPSERRPLSHRR